MPVSRMKILVAYDGSDCADEAIQDLPRAGLPRDVEALVLSVANVWPHLPDEFYRGGAAGAAQSDSPTIRRCRELVEQATAEARELAERGAGRLREQFPHWQVTAESGGGSPQEVIVGAAERWRADLVVVGSNGRSAAGQVLIGSVSQKVLNYAPCSVRVARRPDDAGRLADEPPRLVVGIDGSSDAAAAVSAVADRAWPPATTTRVVTAVDLAMTTALAGLGPTETAWSMPAAADERQWAEGAVTAAADELKSAGLDVTPLVLHGDPKRVLLAAARDFSADCIFVGAKGHSRLERFLLGSVSSSVAARAHCSVEVVRQG